MVATMAVIKMAYAFLMLLSLIAAIFSPWHLPTAAVVILLFILLTVSIPFHVAWSRDFGFLVTGFTLSIIYGIFIFSVIYYRTGLLVDGSLQAISFAEAIYFSVTTWASLGYGDYTAPRPYQLVTSIEALTGYFAMGVFIALIALWINDAIRACEAYLAQLPRLGKQAAKEFAEKLQKTNPEMAEKLRKIAEGGDEDKGKA